MSKSNPQSITRARRQGQTSQVVDLVDQKLGKLIVFVACQILGTKARSADGDDVKQDVLLAFFNKLMAEPDCLETSIEMRAWLLRVANNKAKNVLRHNKRSEGPSKIGQNTDGKPLDPNAVLADSASLAKGDPPPEFDALAAEFRHALTRLNQLVEAHLLTLPEPDQSIVNRWANFDTLGKIESEANKPVNHNNIHTIAKRFSQNNIRTTIKKFRSAPCLKAAIDEVLEYLSLAVANWPGVANRLHLEGIGVRLLLAEATSRKAAK